MVLLVGGVGAEKRISEPKTIAATEITSSAENSVRNLSPEYRCGGTSSCGHGPTSANVSTVAEGMLPEASIAQR